MLYNRLAIEIAVDDDKCMACDPCIVNQECPAKAFIVLDKGEKPFWDGTYCKSCMTCLLDCPYGAVIKIR
jgi:Pyruvate/2-oxoacid:ferredoxin oxidoreductase delta subunit